MSTPNPTPNPANALFEADCWVEALLYIPSLAATPEDGPFPDLLREDFIEGVFDNAEHALLKAFPRLAALQTADDFPEAWQVVEALRVERKGFFVQGGTLVRHYQGEGGQFWSGGSWHTGWLYAETEADIAPTVAAWAEHMHQADRNEKAA